MLKAKSNPDFSNCLQMARDIFDEHFDHIIKNWRLSFPEDYLNSDKLLFWSGQKRFPVPHTFDHTDALHLNFVTACANLIAFNLGIPQVKDKNFIESIVKTQQGKPYVSKKVKTGEEAKAGEESKQ
jgi:ubiquitin-activating enzyme E1